MTKSGQKFVARASKPFCEICQEKYLEGSILFWSFACGNCVDELSKDDLSPGALFALLRQWTPEVQQMIVFLVNKSLSLGIQPNDRDELTDMTLLHYAARSGGLGLESESLKAVKTLLDVGANADLKTRWSHMSPLHFAVFFDCGEVAKFLLIQSDGKYIEERCQEFFSATPLHLAAMNACADTAEILLQFGADIFEKDNLSRTALGGSVRWPEKISIGDSVIVGDKFKGTVRFIGETEFASGIWYGIELNRAMGRNDGMIEGKRYFSAQPSHGIFAPRSKIDLVREAGEEPTERKFFSLERRKTDRRQEPDSQAAMSEGITVVVTSVGASGVIRYVGPVLFAKGIWFGIELVSPHGNNDGEVMGKRYFGPCLENHGIFVKPNMVQATRQSRSFRSSRSRNR